MSLSSCYALKLTQVKFPQSENRKQKRKRSQEREGPSSLAPSEPLRKQRRTSLAAPSASAVNSILPKPLPEPTTAPQNLTEPPQLRGRKRGYLSEDEPSNKRLRKDLQSVSVSSQPLNEANLEEHNRLTESGTSNVMDSEVGTSERGGRKRPSSRPPSSTDTNQETASVRSQTSSYTAARYRFSILSYARIFIRPGPPPEEIQSRINAIIQRKISEERKRQLSRFAENLCKDFIDIFNGASREDDCVEPIHRALSSMDGSRKFQFPRKAGIVFPLLH
jgi:hypothetical protein